MANEEILNFTAPPFPEQSRKTSYGLVDKL